jgi:predicted nucleic acid-binding protein
MKCLIDTCGWIEWLIDGSLADRFEPWLRELNSVIVPTIIQFELYKWVCREKGEKEALEVIALTEQCQVAVFSPEIALLSAELSINHKLSTADAMIYGTARFYQVPLITCDAHFEKLSDVTYFSKL